jgi:hypothetical protein
MSCSTSSLLISLKICRNSNLSIVRKFCRGSSECGAGGVPRPKNELCILRPTCWIVFMWIIVQSIRRITNSNENRIVIIRIDIGNRTTWFNFCVHLKDIFHVTFGNKGHGSSVERRSNDGNCYRSISKQKKIPGISIPMRIQRRVETKSLSCLLMRGGGRRIWTIWFETCTTISGHL